MGQEVVDRDFSRTLSSLLDVGEIMLTSGSEVNRVENTLERMATAYGCKRVDVFTITSSIVVTVHDCEDSVFTQTRRIRDYQTDIYKIEQCNELSRQVCAHPFPQQELEARIAAIRAGKGYPWWVTMLAYALVASSFSIFFGGGPLDAAASALCGLGLYWILRLLDRIRMQRIVTTILASAFVGLLAVGLTRLGLGNSVDKISIGNVMLLIPGISFTTSLRDMISGDTISGLLGLCEAILRAVAIGLGFALVLWQFGM